MRSDHLTKHAKRHPEFNLDEFIVAKRRLDDLVGLEQVDLSLSGSSPSQQREKSKIFLPMTEDLANESKQPTSLQQNNNNNSNNRFKNQIIISDMIISLESKARAK